MGGATDTSPQATATASFPNGTKSSNLAALPEDLELALALKNYVPDTPEERRLVRKIDMILLPCLWWMYILAYLDKGNIVSCHIRIKTCSRTNH